MEAHAHPQEPLLVPRCMDEDDDFDSRLREAFVSSLLALACFAWAVGVSRSKVLANVDTALSGLLLYLSLAAALFSMLAPSVCLLVLTASLHNVINPLRLAERVSVISLMGTLISLFVLLPFAFLYEQAPPRNFLGRISATMLEVLLILALELSALGFFLQFITPNTKSLSTVLCVPGLVCHLVRGPCSLVRCHRVAKQMRIPDEQRPLIRDEIERLTFEILVAKDDAKTALLRQRQALDDALNSGERLWLVLVIITSLAPGGLLIWPVLHRGGLLTIYADIFVLAYYSYALVSITLSRLSENQAGLGPHVLYIAVACLLGAFLPLIAFFFALGNAQSLSLIASVYKVLWTSPPWPGLFILAFGFSLLFQW